MQTKLTLRLESELIERAKECAKEQGKSLSQIVADYFAVFTHTVEKKKQATITQSLIGILEDKDLGEDEYGKHLEGKYL